MGWIHDDENDCNGFHGGFEGGSLRRELSADEKAANAARLASLAAGMDEAVDWTALDSDEGPDRLVSVPGEFDSWACPAGKALGFARAYGYEKARWTDGGLEMVSSWDGEKNLWPFVIADASTA